MPWGEYDVLDALAFHLGISRSKLIYGWVKPHIDEIADNETIQQIIELRAEVRPDSQKRELGGLAKWLRDDRLARLGKKTP